MSRTDVLNISCQVAIRWMQTNLTDYKSPLVQVIVWCHKAPSHLLSQCWPKFMLVRKPTPSIMCAKIAIFCSLCHELVIYIFIYVCVCFAKDSVKYDILSCLPNMRVNMKITKRDISISFASIFCQRAFNFANTACIIQVEQCLVSY